MSLCAWVDCREELLMVNSAYLQYNTSCFHPQIPPADTGCNSQTYATCPQASSLSPFSRSVYVSRGFAFLKCASFSEEGLLHVLLLVCTQQRVLPEKLQKQTTVGGWNEDRFSSCMDLSPDNVFRNTFCVQSGAARSVCSVVGGCWSSVHVALASKKRPHGYDYSSSRGKKKNKHRRDKTNRQ